MTLVDDASGGPLIRLSRLLGDFRLYAKAEHLHPTGSVYDRIAKRLLEEHNEAARTESSAIVVAGSGSLCLAFASAHRAASERELVAVCPASTLVEHRILLEKHRVTVVLSGPEEGLDGVHARAVEEATRRRGEVLVSPQRSEAAARCFEATVGMELRRIAEESLGGRLDVVVAPMESGAALLTGIARALEAGGFSTKLVGTVRPRGERASRQDGVASIDRPPPGFGGDLVAVSDLDALSSRRELARTEGILIGLASAAAVSVARDRAMTAPDGTTVAIIVDAGDRYFSADRVLRGAPG